MNRRTFSQHPRKRGKSHTTTTVLLVCHCSVPSTVNSGSRTAALRDCPHSQRTCRLSLKFLQLRLPQQPARASRPVRDVMLQRIIAYRARGQKWQGRWNCNEQISVKDPVPNDFEELLTHACITVFKRGLVGRWKVSG